MEWGYAVGQGKPAFVLCETLDEPELMYLMAAPHLDPRRVIHPDVTSLLGALAHAY